MTPKKHGDMLMRIKLFKLLFLKKANLCLALPQRFQTFAHKNENPNIYLNTFSDN